MTETRHVTGARAEGQRASDEESRERRVVSARVPVRTVQLDVYDVYNVLCNKSKEITTAIVNL